MKKNAYGKHAQSKMMNTVTYSIHFTKMHSLGNDFVVLDSITQPLKLDSPLAKRIADRRTGVGCDQVLLVDLPSDPLLDFNYRIFNADGKEVAQCGNGARCLGRYLYEQGLARKSIVKLGTLVTKLEVDISDLSCIRVDMGTPSLLPQDVPLQLKHIQALDTTQGHYRLRLPQTEREVTILSMGNPHCVIFASDVRKAPVPSIGAYLQTYPAFPDGVNVCFTQILARNHLTCRVFERGAGETQACGSAACAAVVAGILQDSLNSEVQVDMPGGSLTVYWPGQGSVFLSGPTKTVFRGELRLSG